MLAQAASKLDCECAFVAIEDESTACVDGLGPVVRWRHGDDPAALYRVLGEPTVVTVERESIDVGLLKAMQAFCPVRPNPESVRVGQHRGRERDLLDSLAIPCSPHRVVNTAEEVHAAVQVLGLPLVAKATEAGYDGKLQWRLHTPADVEQFCSEDLQHETLLEQFVNFEREVSLVAARSATGEFRAYPLTENVHRDGILLASIAPAREITPALQQIAEHRIRAIMEKLDYIGVMAVEFFVVKEGLWVNELAPRVHNSGHWTMLGDVASQFENHLRALLGLPLGNTSLRQHTGMFNLLGQSTPRELELPRASAVRWYDYNKAPRPGRKMGHVNVIADSETGLLSSLSALHMDIYGEAHPALEPLAAEPAAP
jgi:5-(carboxyamino)imidazole ribonucleotide synthase